ncbi:MAG: methyltransferase domain-containing protein [Aquificae bacterium]|nr:methyltransferase domain-containing protein [Aquificota bacterium]
MKKIISLQFSRAVEKYEKEIIVQQESAQEIKKLIKDINGLGIDLGCGTGIINQITEKKLIGIDISPDMIERFVQKNNIGIVADIENIPFKNESFDFAVSNFSLHWTTLKKSIPEVYRILKPKGTFIFSIPTKNSLQIIKQSLGQEIFPFYEKEKIKNITAYYFHIEKLFLKNYQIKFKNHIELLKHLKNTGTTTTTNGKTLGKKIQNYKKLIHSKQKPILNFEVLFIKATKINTI